MKKVVFVLALLFVAFCGRAQTWGEWFQQKKTAIKYLVEQISALKVYGSAVKKGYDLLDSGLKSIGGWKKADLLLHQEHFASQSLVNPGVKGSPIVTRMHMLQMAIQQVYRECKTKYSIGEEFTSSEKDYFSTVLKNMLDQCKMAGEETMILTADGQCQMRDDERLKRLQKIHDDMVALYAFARHFRNELATTAVNRLMDRNKVKILKSLYQ